MPKKGLKFRVIMLLAKLAAAVIPLVRKDGGTAFPGTLALKLDKKFYENFRHIPPERIIFITGSNGKSSVTSLLRHIIERNGKRAAYSKKGTNLLPGITSIFINNCKLDGTPKADFFLIEADERMLPVTSAAYTGKHLVITNIMQDQIHRNGDPDYIYRIIEKSIRPDMTLYLNAQEPRSCSFSRFAEARYFGVARHSEAAVRKGEYDVTLPCPICAGKIEFEFENSARAGDFRCRECGFKTPTDSLTLVENVDFDTASFTIDGVSCAMPYTEPLMLPNYAAAACVLKGIGFTASEISGGLLGFTNIAGRIETVRFGDKSLHYIRMKQENPETLQGALDAIARDKNEKLIVIGLCTLDERRPQWVPHYANTYYAYECDFKPVLASNVKHIICFSQYVCSDISLRLQYDGAKSEDMTIIDSDRPDEVMSAVARYDCKDIYIITLLRLFEGFKKYIEGGNIK